MLPPADGSAGPAIARSRRPVIAYVLAAVLVVYGVRTVTDAAIGMGRSLSHGRPLVALLCFGSGLWYAASAGCAAAAVWRGHRSAWYALMVSSVAMLAIVVVCGVPVLLVQGGLGPAAVIPAALFVVAVALGTALLRRPARDWFGFACRNCGAFRWAPARDERPTCGRCGAPS